MYLAKAKAITAAQGNTLTDISTSSVNRHQLETKN